jgi:hypothetical protein
MSFKWIETVKQLPEQGHYLVAFKGDGEVRHYLLLYRTDIPSCRNTWIGSDGHAFETPDYWAKIPSPLPVTVIRDDGETVLPAKPARTCRGCGVPYSCVCKEGCPERQKREATHDKPTFSDFDRHLEEAAKIVAGWPEWKRRVVGAVCRRDEC